MRDPGEFQELKPLLEQIRAHPPLGREEELAVARRARKGDRRAQEQLVIHNLALVVSCVQRFRGRGMRADDLVQEGSCGLIRAAALFRPERGYRFSTYAVWWIRAYLMRALRRGTGVVGRSRTNSAPAQPDLPLDDEQMADEAPPPDEAVLRAEKRARVRAQLRKVRKRLGGLAWTIIQERLARDEQRSLREIGAAWGLSRERVRQVEASTVLFLAGCLRDVA